MAGITALIPARGGSKGVHKKNIAKLSGFPLIAYSIAACKMSKRIDRIVVSTDNDEIAREAIRYGAEVPFMRPARYATDTSTDFDVIKHFLSKQGYCEGGGSNECIAFIRPTTPIRDPKQIDNYIDLYRNSAEYEDSTSARSAHELPESPYKCLKLGQKYFEGFFEDFNGNKNYTNLPRQTLPKAFQPNGYIDLVKPETLVNHEQTFGSKVFPLITEYTLEIDTDYQLDMIRTRMRSGSPPDVLRYLLKTSDIAELISRGIA